MLNSAKGSQNDFENHFVRFIHVLRHLGIRISSAEAIDTFKALELFDFTNRDQVKQAMRATLAKDLESQKLFEQAFDSFFVSKDERDERLEGRHQRETERQESIKQAEEELVFQEQGDESVEAWQQPLNLTEEQKETYSKLPEEKKENIRKFLDHHSEGNPVNDPHQLLESVVQAQLNYWKRKMEEMQKEKDQRNSELDYELTGNEEFDEVIEHVLENFRRDAILYEDMQNIADKDMPKVTLLIRKMARRLATKISRRYKQSQKKKSIDIRKSIRHNIKFGGTMLELKYKTRRIEKPKIILLCDVSGSMAQYASFLLQFTYGLSSAVDNIESFIFAEDLERVTPYFEGKRDFEKTMATIMNQSEQWGKGTDLNTVISKFTTDYRQMLTSNAILIILSDAKTIGGNKVTMALKGLNTIIKDTLWLNTLPKKEWDKIKFVEDFRKYVQMYECYTLAHLDKIMRYSLTKSYK